MALFLVSKYLQSFLFWLVCCHFHTICFFLKFMNWLRTCTLEEEVQMDISCHKGPSYWTHCFNDGAIDDLHQSKHVQAKKNKRKGYGARVGGTKSNTVNLILRLFLYHFLHTMSMWHHKSILNNTNNQQTPPPWWWSRLPLQRYSGVDSMNPRHPSGRQPCTFVVQGRWQRILLDSLN